MHNYPLAVGVHDEREGQDWWAAAYWFRICRSSCSTDWTRVLVLSVQRDHKNKRCRCRAET